MIQATPDEVVADPFPHVIRESFLDPDLYARLKDEFPANHLFDREVSVGGRAGRDIYRGDPEMAELLEASKAWQEFHDFINSSAYLEKTLELFGSHLERFECALKAEDARFGDYVEPRSALVAKPRALEALSRFVGRFSRVDPNDLYARLDIHQGATAYGKPIHCDRDNRFVSMIVYFCDAGEIECEGGGLSIHAHRQKKPYRDYERHPRPDDTEVVATVEPKDNLGVFFLCANNSYHSVEPIHSQAGFRNFIYVNLSSRAPTLW